MSFLRRRLPNRRASETFEVEAQGLRFTASVSRYTDGTPAEIFLCNHKASSAAGIFAQDIDVVASIALRYGVPLDVLRRALMRDAQGGACGPLVVALDRLATFDQEVA
jgi:hypothetical protein